jgi:hypothetical protein
MLKGLIHLAIRLWLSIVIIAFLSFANTPSTQQIQVEFMASKLSWGAREFVGHAFMCISVPVGAGIKEDCYGFYPKEGGKGVIQGPGVINPEFQKNPARFSRVTVSIKKPITLEQRRQILTMVDEWDTKDYDLIDQNCNDFINSIAQALGWNTPPRDRTDLPETFLKKLKEAN